MLIPHLHFRGDCKEAITVYEKAFDTKAEDDIDYAADGVKIANAAMDIHGQRVFLNDAMGNMDKSLDMPPVHLIITFKTPEELLVCYDKLKEGGVLLAPFAERQYSKLCGNFMDRFGILWGFMADA